MELKTLISDWLEEEGYAFYENADIFYIKPTDSHWRSQAFRIREGKICIPQFGLIVNPLSETFNLTNKEFVISPEDPRLFEILKDRADAVAEGLQKVKEQQAVEEVVKEEEKPETEEPKEENIPAKKKSKEVTEDE